MTSIYANLIGEWVRLNDDPDCKMGTHMTSPDIWWEENAEIYNPVVSNKDLEDSMYGLPYVHIHYRSKDYRISPFDIQVKSIILCKILYNVSTVS